MSFLEFSQQLATLIAVWGLTAVKWWYGMFFIIGIAADQVFKYTAWVGGLGGQ